MTREELKAHCQRQIEMCETWAYGRGEKPSGKVYEEHKLILELLEQQSCEDCISRQAVMNCFKKWQPYMATRLHEFEKELTALPPVTPQQKIGYWIEEIDDYGEVIGWHCDQCYEDSGFTTDCKSNFCPNCGAKMQEVEE